ncbi:phenylalanine--tRNA ligase subunit alpha [Candidatus Woesearchaeota archaeon]|nr:phenylalanine--tRNA ligase subunit alpha [Candidatus Woesearchaeota archaeon]
MEVEKLAETLHPLERAVLPHLSKYSNLDEIAEASKLKQVEAMRALQWLENKGALKIISEEQKLIILGKNGRLYHKNGLPERRFIEAIKDKPLSYDELRKKAALDMDELHVCIGLLKRKVAVEVKDGKVSITPQGKSMLTKKTLEEQLLEKSFPVAFEKLKPEEKFAFEALLKRKDIVDLSTQKTKYVKLTSLGEKLANTKIRGELIETLTPKMLKTSSWQGNRFRRYDISINVPAVFPGRRHFVNQAIDYVRQIWLELGFKEMQGSLVQTSFWNFDALFTAQDHPVREMQDTYYIKNPKSGKLPSKQLVEQVKKTHEDGWTTGSKGWQYKWDAEGAKRNVLRTHTTCLSARTIAQLKQGDLPAKFFAVGKNFRNETLDWSHLFELIQVEGIVVDPDANFTHLVGYLKNFFHKMGFSRVRVRPGYFPYTEPSAEVDVYHPIHKRWMELGGSGMFRPEMTKPLFGKEVPVLAWGLGLDRTILQYYALTDIRELYKNDLREMKKMRLWLK